MSAFIPPSFGVLGLFLLGIGARFAGSGLRCDALAGMPGIGLLMPFPPPVRPEPTLIVRDPREGRA